MRYGLDISAAGPWGDPRTMADMAALSERSGWDCVFLEDYVFFPERAGDVRPLGNAISTA